jgi:hypothetical protein
MPIRAFRMERLRSPGLSRSLVQPSEKTMSDLLYLAGGVAVLLLFAAYAALLKRA